MTGNIKRQDYRAADLTWLRLRASRLARVMAFQALVVVVEMGRRR